LLKIPGITPNTFTYPLVLVGLLVGYLTDVQHPMCGIIIFSKMGEWAERRTELAEDSPKNPWDLGPAMQEIPLMEVGEVNEPVAQYAPPPSHVANSMTDI
jgi:hypothetical protein